MTRIIPVRESDIRYGVGDGCGTWTTVENRVETSTVICTKEFSRGEYRTVLVAGINGSTGWLYRNLVDISIRGRKGTGWFLGGGM